MPARPVKPVANPNRRLPETPGEFHCHDNGCLCNYNFRVNKPSIESATAAAAPAPFYDARNYVVAESVGNLMYQVVLSMRRDIERGMAAHGLTAAQWHPLWMLKLGKATTAQELACQLAVDAGAVTRLLDRLEAKGLVTRERSSSDRRVVRLSLTPQGEATIEQAPAVLAEVNNKHLRGFSRDEWRLLQDLLGRMLANTAEAADCATDTPADAPALEISR